MDLIKINNYFLFFRDIINEIELLEELLEEK